MVTSISSGYVEGIWGNLYIAVYGWVLKIELFIAEISAAPRAMHSLELRVLEGSTPYTYSISFIITGILVPPPISSMWLILMFICLISPKKSSKSCLNFNVIGKQIFSNSYLFMV